MKKNLLFLLLFVFGASIGKAQFSSWAYKKPIVITENSSASLTNYQIPMYINTSTLVSAGKLQADLRDLRFAEDSIGFNPLIHFVDSGKNTSSTKVWVKLNSLGASQTDTIYMFYGNSSALNTSTYSTFIGPKSATDSVVVTTNGGVAQSLRGFTFTPNKNIIVTNFGKREPNGATKLVSLWDYSAQTIILSDSVHGSIAGQYSYDSLPQHVWLKSGKDYICTIYQGASGSGTENYYYGSSSQINPDLTYVRLNYCNGCTPTTFPSSSLNNYHYGQSDFLFYSYQKVTPEPTYTVGGEGPIITTVKGLTYKGAFNYKLYPNPANDKVNIEFTELSENGDMEIIVKNVMGETIARLSKESVITMSSYTFDLSSEAKGIYFIDIRVGNNKRSGTLILN